MQLLNSNIPQSARITKYSNKKAQDLLNLVLFLFCSFFVLQRWRKRGDSLRDIFPSSLVIALLLLYFSHFYYFIVAKCERRQQVAAYSSSEFPPIKKDTQGVYIKGIQPFPASGNFINCSERIRTATFRLLLVLISFYFYAHFLSQCCYHAGVANDRFIGCLVGLLLLSFIVSFASRLPTRSNPLSATSKQNEQANFCLFVLFGGSEGIHSATLSSSLVIALLLLYSSHFYYFIVAITPGVQTTVSSVVWSACFCCCIWHRLQADTQPVRIPFQQRQSKTNRQIFACSFCLAEARGFEPLSP